MVKKIILSAAVMFAAIPTFAQHEVGSVTIQPKLGVNVSNFTDLKGVDPRVGVAGGAELEYQVHDIISLSAGAMYSMQGTKAADKGISLAKKVDYINVPVLVNVYVVPGLAVKLGLQPGFKVSESTDIKVASLESNIKTKAIDTFDLSLPIGLSYEFNNFVMEGRYNFGLKKLADNIDHKNSVFQFTLGYKFGL